MNINKYFIKLSLLLIVISLSSINSELFLHKTKVQKIIDSIKEKNLDKDEKFKKDVYSALNTYLKFSKREVKDRAYHDELNSELINNNLSFEASALGFYKFLFNSDVDLKESQKEIIKKRSEKHNKDDLKKHLEITNEIKKSISDVLSEEDPHRFLEKRNLDLSFYFMPYDEFSVMDFDICRPECYHGCEACDYNTPSCRDYGAGQCPAMLCANNYSGTWVSCNCGFGIGCHVDFVCDGDYIFNHWTGSPVVWGPCNNPTGKNGDVGNVCSAKPVMFIDFIPICYPYED